MRLALSPLLLAAAAASAPAAALAFAVSSLSSSSSPLVRSSPAFAWPAAARLSSSPRTVDRRKRWATVLSAAGGDDDDEEEKVPENPYADPNYPDLEFVNYDDPDYSVDQGTGDEFSPSESQLAAAGADSLSEDDTLEKIEEMREERRRKNDEYQFETYHAEVLRSGEDFKGEWTVYRTNTFLPGQEGEGADENGMPRLVKSRRAMRVVSSGRKVDVKTDSDWRVDGERIIHEERLETDEDADTDSDGSSSSSEEEKTALKDQEAAEWALLSRAYYPEHLSADDFRGHQGIMCVGNAYTTCDAVPIKAGGATTGEEAHAGPFLEYRTEMGLQYKRMRFRIKLDYRTLEDEGDDVIVPPPLHLRSLTVCRETRERWPRYGSDRTDVEDASSSGLFGPPGADGGLYDPPPVGSDKQASMYMMLDLEGRASVLFPYSIDQRQDAFEGKGWVTSLDWTPGRMRYQVDRKIRGGAGIKGLRTLELSEVQGAEADQWRPKDGGSNMRQ